MLVYSGQHSKGRVGVLNSLKQAIIKVYFPWYQRNGSEKQATGLWGTLSIKYRLLASSSSSNEKLELNQHLLNSFHSYWNLCEVSFL